MGTRRARWLARGRVPDRARGRIPGTRITTGEVAVVHAAQKEAGADGIEEQHVACKIGQREGTGHTPECTIEDAADDGADEDEALVDEVVVGLAGGLEGNGVAWEVVAVVEGDDYKAAHRESRDTYISIA